MEQQGDIGVGSDGVTQVSTRVRRRQLASDRRAGTFPRGLARRRQYAFIGAHARILAAAVALCVAALLASARFMPSERAQGALVGGGVVAVLSALWHWIVAATGTAPTEMGERSEQWTAQELRRLHRAGWRVINHVMLSERDIDHVLVGPGGVIAVETKWSAQAWRWDPADERIMRAAVGVRAKARQLRLWHNLRSLGVGPVRPVLFLWGPGARQIPSGADLDGVGIVTGRTAAQWRDGLGSGQLSKDQIEAAWSVLDEQCRRRDPDEQPVPASPSEWTVRVVLAVAAACVAVLATSVIAVARAPWPLWLPWWVAMLAIGVLAARIESARLAAIGWLVGVLATFGYCAVVLLDWYV